MMDSDEDQGQHDAYLERMKAEGAGRDSDALDDDSDSSGKALNNSVLNLTIFAAF